MLKPSFEKGSILKQNMLETLRDYPRNAVNLVYEGFGDGIIDGFDITVLEGNKLLISPGIVKVGGIVYFSIDEQVIDQHDNNNYVYIEVKYNDTVDGIVYCIEINQSSTQQSNKVELFRYTKNAELSMLQNCDDLFSPPINRINRIYSGYSYIGGTSLCPDYYKVYAREVLRTKNANMEDIAFSYECLNGIRDMDLVKEYFKNEVSNISVIELMKKRLSEISRRDESPQVKPEKPQEPRKMIVS